MRYFGMKLYSIQFPALVRKSRRGTAVRARRYFKAFGQYIYVIGMAHPTRAFLVHTAEERIVAIADISSAVFSDRSGLDRAAQSVRHQLRAVAYAENRHACIIYRIVNLRCVGRVYAVGTACKNHSDRRRHLYLFSRPRIRNKLAIYIMLSYFSGYQLIVLTAEIHYYYRLMRHNYLL